MYPGADWARIADPRAAGYSPARLAALRADVARTAATGMMIVVGGRVLAAYGDVAEVSYLASARKSLMAMLYGPQVASGRIRLDGTLGALGIDDVGGLLPAEREATVGDLLAARSGVYHPAANAGDATDRAPARGSVPPGSYFLYNNWDFNALGTIYERQTGRDIYDAFGADLAGPLGFQDWHRGRQEKHGDTTRSVHRAYHFWLSTRDMARLGYLMLREGRWEDRQLLPREWVRRSTRLVTPAAEVARTSRFAPRLGYGYLWWVFDPAAVRGTALEGAYTASGAYGQFITVIPALDMVVAHKVAVTKPPPDRSVPADVYLGPLIDRIVALRCSAPCP